MNKTQIPTSDLPEFARTPVDVAQTSLFEGREFRSVRKLVIGSNKEVVWKFESSVDFMLFEQSISVGGGSYEFYVWREDNVTELLAIATPVKIINKNGSNEYRKYDNARYVGKATIKTSTVNNVNTTLTIADSEDYYDVESIEASNNSSHATTVGGSENSTRYLPAGVYYLHHKNTSNSEIIVRYAIAWEERPPYLQKTN